jgi:hypothetical protein
MDYDYKALAIKYAKEAYDHSTGYSFKPDLEVEEVDKSHCTDCGASVPGDDRALLKHKDDCINGEIHSFLVAHGVRLARNDS